MDKNLPLDDQIWDKMKELEDQEQEKFEEFRKAYESNNNEAIIKAKRAYITARNNEMEYFNKHFAPIVIG